MEPSTKRITVKLKTPNPLFEKWITEWRDKAKEKDSKMQHTFNIALKSLKKYPIPFSSGKECMVLKGFGPKLCEMLDNKLKEHKNKQQNGDITIDYEYVEEDPKKTKQTKKKMPLKSPNTIKLYTPAYRSGAYAILRTMLKKGQEYLTKQEIIENARDLCDKSFTKPDPGKFYTAWSSMKTLIIKNLIEKQGSPAKYLLTDKGVGVALQLIENQENVVTVDQNLPSCSQNVISKIPIESNIQSLDILDEIVEKTSEGSSIKNAAIKKSSDSQKDKEIMLSNEDNTQTSSNVETIIFAVGTFDILLLVDTQETEGSNKSALDDDTKYELNKLGILYEIRHMKVGDFTWICQDRATKNELVLPYVAERKRMDDLGGSIKDGRFHEQKFRLKQCGIQNLIYIIESFGSNTHTGLPLASLMQAATNTLIQDGFQVKFTENHRHSMQYLAVFTMILKKYYENKTVMSCTKDDITKHTVSDEVIPLLTFKEFNKGGSKQKDHTVKDLFVKQILQLKGISVQKALAITEKYPTPRILKQEYEKLGPKGENLLAKIEFGPLKRTIGAVISRSIYQLYTSEKLL